MEAKLKKMKVTELKKELAKFGLSTSGNKSDMVSRLSKHYSEEKAESTAEANNSDDGDINQKNKRKAEETQNEEPNSLKRSKSVSQPSLKRSGSVYEVDNSYVRVREGPAEASLIKLQDEDKNLVFGKKNLEITNNSPTYYYYNLDYAISNVHVNSGKWYYEVKLIMSGQMQFGWCTSSYHPNKGNGSFWGYDCSRQQKFCTNGGDGEKFGEYCANGDILGCSLDMENKTIQYWKNGKDLGTAFTNVIPEPGGRLTPYIGLSRRVSVLFNFGRETFAFPQDGYNMLHCFLSEKEISKLAHLFNKYRDMSETETEEKKETAQSEVDQEKIYGAGLIQFQKDLGVVDDEDPLMLIVFWKLNCKPVWEISRSEFMNGFTIYGCCTIEQMRAKSKEWHEEIRSNEQQFKKFYNFVFDYLKEDKTILLIDEAIVSWNIVLKEKKWGLYQEWLNFLNAEGKKSISRDVWQQLWHFMAAYPDDLKDYDSASSWPIIYDDFVEWVKEKKEKK